MNVLLIDRTDWEGEEPVSRISQIRNAIVNNGDTATEVTVDPRQSVPPHNCPLIDAVVIHCSTQQIGADTFLTECCESIPVLGYAAGGCQPETRRFFKNKRSSSAFIQLGQDVPTDRIAHWVRAIANAGGNSEAIKSACEAASGFKPELEQNLLELIKANVPGADLLELRKKRDGFVGLGQSC